MVATADTSLRSAIIKSAEAAYTDHKITRRQLRRVRSRTLSPRVMSRIDTFCREEATFDGVAGVDGLGFDWMAILQKLIEWLPEILKIISLFSSELGNDDEED